MAFSRVLACVAVLSVPSLALAQAPPEPPPPTHEETFEAAYVGVSGNASTRTVGLGADLISRPDTWLFRNKVKFTRNESNDELTASVFDFTSRAQKALNARASVFGEYGFFRDRFAGVDDRNVVNGGLALKVVETPRQTLGAELGLGYLNEHRVQGDDISSGDYFFGGAYTLKLSANAEVTDDARMTGLFSQSDDWRFENTVSITTKIAAGFSLKLSNGIRYVNFPPPGFKKTDAITSVALVAKFAQP